MVISLVKLSFLFNSEITVFHRYLYNNIQYVGTMDARCGIPVINLYNDIALNFYI
jgi:hypothetical protein